MISVSKLVKAHNTRLSPVSKRWKKRVNLIFLMMARSGFSISGPHGVLLAKLLWLITKKCLKKILTGKEKLELLVFPSIRIRTNLSLTSKIRVGARLSTSSEVGLMPQMYMVSGVFLT